MGSRATIGIRHPFISAGQGCSDRLLAEIARATSQRCSNASRIFNGVQVYGNHRMRRYLRRRKRRTGLGMYQTTTMSACTRSSAWPAWGGPCDVHADSGCVKGRAGSRKSLPTDRRGAGGNLGHARHPPSTLLDAQYY